MSLCDQVRILIAPMSSLQVQTSTTSGTGDKAIDLKNVLLFT